MQMVFCNSNDKAYQAKLNRLLRGIFLDFTFWYDLNLWNEQYESYAIEHDDRLVANVCLYKSLIQFHGRRYPAISVGAVATHPDFRGRGYARQLMEHVTRLYDGTPMYLSANEAVLDFYPRFGFRRIFEKQPVCDRSIENENINPVHRIRQLTFNDPLVWRYVYERCQFSPVFDCLNTQSVNLFHLYAGYLKPYIYELPDLSTMIIARQEGDTLKLTGVFSKRSITFAELSRQLPFHGIRRIAFGFMPCWSDLSCRMTSGEADPWFVRGVSCDLGDIKFPELSVT